MFLGFLKIECTHFAISLMDVVRVITSMNAATDSILVPKFRFIVAVTEADS